MSLSRFLVIVLLSNQVIYHNFTDTLTGRLTHCQSAADSNTHFVQEARDGNDMRDFRE